MLASTSAALPLRALPVLFVDCQSTGATPAHGALLEVAWARGDAPVTSALVALPEGASIPPYVRRITGLDAGQLAGALAPDEVWRRLTRVTRRRWRGRRALRARRRSSTSRASSCASWWTCTPRTARAPSRSTRSARTRSRGGSLPDLPRRGLRALSGYFGAPAGELRRSAHHALATRAVWRAMSALLEDRGVRTIDELRAWMLATEVARPLARGWPMPASERAGLPDAPGVYRMRRVDGSLLYVGKASSLKKRVTSYFTRKRKIPERTVEMLTQARRLEVTRTETTLEAALLEHDEIKAHAPAYNVALRGLGARARAVGPRAARRRVGAGDRSARLRGARPARGRACGTERAPTPRARLDVPPVWAPEAAALVEGAALFAARHPVALDVPSLMALGSALFRREEEGGRRRAARRLDARARRRVDRGPVDPRRARAAARPLAGDAARGQRLVVGGRSPAPPRDRRR
ncbi:MAG: GIY-YIG nuclease family protein [Sandaracinaceae bacterium]|nr:GIY-YIG nuclease family protein [Sandaracinaceae bacterium]